MARKDSSGPVEQDRRRPDRRSSELPGVGIAVAALAIAAPYVGPGLNTAASAEVADHVIPGAEPKAGTWKTRVLSSAAQVRVPSPPPAGSAQARQEAAELADLAGRRTPDVDREAHRWGDYPPTEPWTTFNMQLVSEQSKNPPLAARGYALVSAAVYDAVVSAWHWKDVYHR